METRECVASGRLLGEFQAACWALKTGGDVQALEDSEDRETGEFEHERVRLVGFEIASVDTIHI